MKKYLIGIFIAIFLISATMSLQQVQANKSGLFLGSSYVEQFTSLDNSSYYNNVETSNGLLQLAIDSYLPSDGDNWTEISQNLDGTNAWWYAGDDVAVNQSRLNVFHYDLSVNDNYSTEIELTDTGAGDTFTINFLAVDPDTYDITDYTNLRWYFCMLTPSAIDNPLHLMNVTLKDNNTIAKNSTYLLNQSVTNTWQLYDVVLDNFYTDSGFDYSGLTQISWSFVWDSGMLEENITLLFDHLAFYTYENNGTYISDWVTPSFPLVIWENAICWTTNIESTKFYVTWDNETWTEITSQNGTSSQTTDNLLFNTQGLLSIYRPIMFKIVLFANSSSPLVDFVVIEYDSLLDRVILLQLARETLIIPNMTWNNILYILWGLTVIVGIFDIYNRAIRKMGKKVGLMQRLRASVIPLLYLALVSIVVFSIISFVPDQLWQAIQRYLGYVILNS